MFQRNLHLQIRFAVASLQTNQTRCCLCRSGGRRSKRSRSRSESGGHRRAAYSQRDRWKRDPSYSPVLILRKNRSPNRKHCCSGNSPQRISELGQIILKLVFHTLICHTLTAATIQLHFTIITFKKVLCLNSLKSVFTNLRSEHLLFDIHLKHAKKNYITLLQQQRADEKTTE